MRPCIHDVTYVYMNAHMCIIILTTNPFSGLFFILLTLSLLSDKLR